MAEMTDEPTTLDADSTGTAGARSGGVVAFDDLDSPLPHEQSAGQRLDPYWDGLWEPGASVPWLSKSRVDRIERAGWGRLPAKWKIDEEEAWATVFSRRRWLQRLGILGTIQSWRTVTSEQIAAIVGAPWVARGTSKAMASFFTTGLIDVGETSHGVVNTVKTQQAYLYRPSRTRVFETKINPKLSYPEQINVNGGPAWSTGGQYDRHNVLATEICLRAAEYCPNIVTVLGEKFSTFDMLAGTGVGRTEITANNSADGLMIRDDGLRIAVELTATLGQGFAKKVRSWARLLSNSPMSHTGLTALFVIAPHPERKLRHESNSLGDKVRTVISRAVREFSGSASDRVADRIAVVSWTDLFPSRGRVDQGFATMNASRPTGPADDRWQPVSMLDHNSLTFEPSANFDPLTVVSNAAALGSVPYWLREQQQPPELIDEWFEAEFPDGPPIPIKPTPEALSRMVAAPKPPRRLRTYNSNR